MALDTIRLNLIKQRFKILEISLCLYSRANHKQ
jgi:hypothetical protein